MRFSLVFELNPSAPFGVPEEGQTVLPPGEHVGDTFHVRALTRVKYGALSQYRKDSDRINVSLDLPGCTGRLEDNFLFLDVEAVGAGQALRSAQEVVQSLLDHLSVKQKRTYDSKLMLIEDEHGGLHPSPAFATMLSVTTYDLGALRANILEAQDLLGLEDDRLFKSLSYYQHALFLWQHVYPQLDPLSRHLLHLTAAVFLNLWKAVTTLTGDPAIRADRYQKRWREIGLSEDDKKRLDRLKELRDNYDVAHYSLDENKPRVVQHEIGEAINACAHVIDKYRARLADPLESAHQ